MAKVRSVADAKKNLSELMSRAAYNNERFLIQRRGKPMAALLIGESQPWLTTNQFLEKLDENLKKAMETW